jgi:HD-like signal output (HDOD) protein
LAAGVFSQFERQPASNCALAALWTHSNAVGAIAKRIATQECPAIATDAFTAGLLHDIGEVVLAANLPVQAAAVLELIGREKISKLAAEKQIFEATHIEVGAYLLSLWGLPNAVVEAVAFHHTPNADTTEAFTALTAVLLADNISPLQGQVSSLDVEYLTKRRLLEKWPHWQASYAPLQENAVTRL